MQLYVLSIYPNSLVFFDSVRLLQSLLWPLLCPAKVVEQLVFTHATINIFFFSEQSNSVVDRRNSFPEIISR